MRTEVFIEPEPEDGITVRAVEGEEERTQTIAGFADDQEAERFAFAISLGWSLRDKAPDGAHLYSVPVPAGLRITKGAG